MRGDNYFKIKIKRNIPYVTNAFLLIACICFCVFLIFDFLFVPFKNVDREIQYIVFRWFYPKLLTYIYVFSIIGTVTTGILYTYLRFYRSAVLSFNQKEILIRGRAIRIIIRIGTINGVIINDPVDQDGDSKQTLYVTITHKSTTENIKLSDYSESEDFIKHFVEYENLNVRFYELPAV